MIALPRITLPRITLARDGLAPRDRLVTALDVADVDTARRLVDTLGDTCRFYKIGYRLAYAGGLDLADELLSAGHRVFLDLKLLDIDNTVREGVAALSARGATCLTVHAYPHAMRAAVAGRSGGTAILAVTVLTSLGDEGLRQTGYRLPAGELVKQRAVQAARIGVDGIVCSGREAALVRACAPDLAIVTPGIRPAGAARGDQTRAVTPAEAIRAGADYLVVGRPITQSADPRGAAEGIVREIAAA